MKTLQVLVALAVLLGIALAVYLGRPGPPDDSPFGTEMALPANLAPLEFPAGTLELAGIVRTTAGTPAEDALVSLLHTDEVEEQPLHWAYTDATGRFLVQHVSPGKYRVVLSHRSAPPKSFELELPLAGASEVSWELAAPLPALEELPEIRRASVSGRLLPRAIAGSPENAAPALAGCEIVIAPAPDTPLLSGASERRTTADAEGRFAFEGLVCAIYRVEVLPPWAKSGSWPVIGRGTLGAAEGAPNAVQIALEVGALGGELDEAEGRPLAGALVKVSALEALDAVGEPQTWPPEVTDANGRFRLDFLPPGRYRVHLRAGLAHEDVEVSVEIGKLAAVVLAPLDPRSGG